MTVQLDLRCPVDERHRLATARLDVAGCRLYPRWRSGVTSWAPGRQPDPHVDIRLEGTRLRWRCPACRSAGIAAGYDDRQLRWDRVTGLAEAAVAAGVGALRVRLDANAIEDALAKLHEPQPAPHAPNGRDHRLRTSERW